MIFKELYESDIKRYKKSSMGNYLKRFHYHLRKSQTCNSKIFGLWHRFWYKKIRESHGIELSYRNKIGKGLYIGHPWNITVNPLVEIGENVNIHKGVTIGQENRGTRCGVPKIGNKVWIGINATVVGNVTIGDDVLIAPNSFVNCDVPAHSIVFGNPCIIKHRDNATEGYINNTI